MLRTGFVAFAFALAILHSAAGRSAAHFVFVVPQSDGTKAKVILSEDLDPDAEIALIEAGKSSLSVKSPGGPDAKLSLRKIDDNSCEVELPGSGTRVVHGTCDLGVMQRGPGKPFLIVYHPKTILGGAFDQVGTLGENVPVELVPERKAGELVFKVLAGGRPAADVEVNLVLPDGERTKISTGADGRTAAVGQVGRYGAWARYVAPDKGERDGKPYEETRHYATLVVDFSSAAEASLPPLPEAASSFGAVACQGALYVYGGHIAPVHTYSTEAVSSHFWRLKLSGSAAWESLPGGPGLQGMNLATDGSKVYRVGGMEPRNKPGDPTDNHSTAECACFDPATGQWSAMPPLPEPRSSHDVAVVDGKLYVVGGWTMRGDDGDDWLNKALVMDLRAPQPSWQTLEQPFERRALIAAVLGNKLYVIGGFNEDNRPERRVDIYDTAAKQWSKGPELPGADHNGFAPAACAADDRLFVSVADGNLYRLNASGSAWEGVTKLQPRIVHRLVPKQADILVIGGARGMANLDTIEVVNVAPKKAGDNDSASTGATAK